MPKDAKPVNGDNSLWTNFRSKLTNAPAIAGLSLGRALGAPLAPLLYGFGFLAVAAGAVGFNVLALLALRKLQKSQAAMVT